MIKTVLKPKFSFQRLRVLFDNLFDEEGFGEVPVDVFIESLKQPQTQDQVPINKRELLYERAIKVTRNSGVFTFDDFVSVVSLTIIHSSWSRETKNLRHIVNSMLFA